MPQSNPLSYQTPGGYRTAAGGNAGAAGVATGTVLSPELVQQHLATARLAAKPIRRAVVTANFDAITVLLFGIPTFLYGLFGSPLGLMLGGAMCVIGYVEITNARKLRRLDPLAPRRLAYNQFAFAAVLIVYALWCLGHTDALVNDLKAQIGTDQDVSVADISDVVRICVQALYWGLIAIAVFAQGGLGLYYLSRERKLADYLQNVPAWVVEGQKTGAAL